MENKEARVTIRLTPDLVQKIDSRVPEGKRSKYIRKVLKTWFEVVDNE